MKEKVLRVLLVDDDEEALSECKEAFKRRGFRVSTTHSAEDAILQLFSNMDVGIRFDVVMSDFDFGNPQGGNGLTLHERMRKDVAFKDTIFILYTARSINEEGIARIIAADTRATHFLKPKDMGKVVIPFILGELSCIKR